MVEAKEFIWKRRTRVARARGAGGDQVTLQVDADVLAL
jgi:hypothetical protein